MQSVIQAIYDSHLYSKIHIFDHIRTWIITNYYIFVITWYNESILIQLDIIACHLHREIMPLPKSAKELTKVSSNTFWWFLVVHLTLVSKVLSRSVFGFKLPRCTKACSSSSCHCGIKWHMPLLSEWHNSPVCNKGLLELLKTIMCTSL